MLRDSPAFSGFAVPDIDRARTFYRDTLGLETRDGSMACSSCTLVVGPS
jgi:predicted enzyme related to lactoylglutathione lyase